MRLTLAGLSSCFIGLLFSTSLSAQSFYQTIRGTVIDADAKSVLPGVNVVLLDADTTVTAVTTVEGNFRLPNVKVGRRAVKFSFVGYEDLTLHNIVVTSGKEVVLNVQMHEKVVTGQEVLIIAEKDKTKTNNELITNSARSFQSEETERYAGVRGDPSRMVANFAGVSSGSDARNDIIVRGNSPLGVLWRLEGIDIPNPNHFSNQGATGGPVSMLNNNLLGASDFLTGAFPAEYGNKYAAVFDLKLRNGNNEKTEYMGQVGLNGLEAGIEGPLFKKNGGSFLINYRYSTLALFKTLGINFGVSAIPHYSDFACKLNLPTPKSGVFTFWAMGGLSDISLLDSERDSADWTYAQKGEDIIFTSSMIATGLSHVYFFNTNLSGKVTIGYNGSKYKVEVDSLRQNKTNFRVYNNTSYDEKAVFNYTLTSKLSAQHLLKAGVTYEQLFFNYQAKFYSRLYNEYREQLNEKNNSGLVQGFIHWQYRITDKLSLNSGLHYQNFLLNNSQAIEPRAGIRWQFNEKHSLSLAYGMHSQIQPLVYYFFRTYYNNAAKGVITNRELDLTRSNHLVAAYDFNFARDFRFKFETYYQQLYDVPVKANEKNTFSILNIGGDLQGLPLIDSLTNNGTGRNYGTEFTLEKFFSKQYYFLTTLSLYQSKYAGSDRVLRNTAYNGGYVYNVLGGVELPLGNKNTILSFDTKITFAGGNRYTPINLQASAIKNDAVYYTDLTYAKQLRDYQRIDFKMGLKKNQRHVTHTVFIIFENIFNHKNVLRQFYDTSTRSIKTEYQLGLFYYGGYRIEF